MLEIMKLAAETLGKSGMTFALETPGGRGTAELKALPCTCRGADHPHEHWFLVSPLFQAFVPGSTVQLALDDQRVIVSQPE